MFKEGDIIQIRKNLSIHDRVGTCNVNEEMVKFKGLEGKIVRSYEEDNRKYYTISVDKLKWTWVKEFFEPKKERNEI